MGDGRSPGRSAPNPAAGCIGKGGKQQTEKAVDGRETLHFSNAVAAAAAAAIEQPTHTSLLRTVDPESEKTGDMIRDAQREAERRRIGVAPAPPDVEIDERIRNAQLRNIPAAQADDMTTPKWSTAFQDVYSPQWGPSVGSYDGYGNGVSPGHARAGEPLSPEELLGNWVHESGNSVLVYSIDAWECRLMASVHRPPRPELQLHLRPTADAGWICGNSTLDLFTSSLEELHWVGPDQRRSVWYRGRT